MLWAQTSCSLKQARWTAKMLKKLFWSVRVQYLLKLSRVSNRSHKQFALCTGEVPDIRFRLARLWCFVLFGLVFCVFLQCFDTVGWVIWPIKTRPHMTYNVFGGMLSLTQSIQLFLTIRFWIWPKCWMAMDITTRYFALSTAVLDRECRKIFLAPNRL